MWTSERVAELKDKIAAGLSRGAIANEWGVSRNTIIGKCTRLGLVCNNSRNMGGTAVALKKRKGIAFGESGHTRVTKMRSSRKGPLSVEIPVRPDEPEPLLVSLLDLTEFQCRWVCEGTDDRCLSRYCGHPARNGRWCDYHASRVWVRR